MRNLRRFGEIFSLAVCSGLELQGTGTKRSLRCPLPGHDDQSSSAVIFGISNCFHCSVCTPGSSLTFEEFEEALKQRGNTFSTRRNSERNPGDAQEVRETLRLPDTPAMAPSTSLEESEEAPAPRTNTFSPRPLSDQNPSDTRASSANGRHRASPSAPRGTPTPPRKSTHAPAHRQPTFSTRTSSSETDTEAGVPTRAFTAPDASRIWELALARTRDDRYADAPEDKLAYRYLAARGLMPAWEESAFGIITSDMNLPDAIRTWPGRGYHIVAPLYSVDGGEIANVQARTIQSSVRPKAIFPTGSRARGAVFADRRGLEVLRGDSDHRSVLIGEGMTDYLCLAIHSPVPVLCSAGAGGARHAVGDWVRDRVLFVAVDCDSAGDAAVDAVSAEALSLLARQVVRVRWPSGAKDACDAVRLLGSEGLGCLLDELVRNETKAVALR